MDNWKVAYAPNYLCKNIEFCTIKEILNSGYDIINAEVPGSLEQALMKAKKLPDLFFGTNVFKAQEFENYHTWYFIKFDVDSTDSFLRFGGIDTISDIYVNGKFIRHTDNMFISYDIYPQLKEKDNELIVHIYPACIFARQYTLTSACLALPYNYESLYIRKAPHMFGWDIMPRIVSSGIWKSVELMPVKKDSIKDAYLFTVNLNEDCADLSFYANLELAHDNIKNYTVELDAICKNNSFCRKFIPLNTSFRISFSVNDFILWWPKNSGEPNLYDVTVSLKYNGKVCDIKRFRFGIRTVELDRTDTTAKDGSGEFCFKINRKKIFVLGTNWVPLDAFHSNDKGRLKPALELLDDIGCNMVRCWGGNVYESDEFFDFCDERGIMVWQDFAMACGVYPQEKEFLKKIEEEAVFQIKRLRQHPSLVLWAGDNECDQFYRDNNFKNPDRNIITRRLLPDIINANDITRPFLPSSPYISSFAYENNLPTSEEHLWGPRDYFKGDFYKNSVCHFASETGYHGCPSPKSMKCFLDTPWPWKNESGSINQDWLAHASCSEPGEDNPYAYRIQLMADQVKTLFGSIPDNFDTFSKQSQISQAEAKKYFIERFRISKWRRTGIIWWNLIDGWPQISDAVVDYYYTKKIAYHFIKRSQQPFCMMFDEPENGKIALYGVNDLAKSVIADYKIINVTSGKLVLEGNTKINADSSKQITLISYVPQNFYLIEWTAGGKTYKNHYFTDIININYDEYMTALKKCGFDEFEGF